MSKNTKILLCDYINPISDKSCEFVREGAIAYQDGIIVGCGKKEDILLKFSSPEVEVFDYSDQLALPAFFDMHFHWVQDDVRLRPKTNLLQWLQKYTWPYEKKFEKKSFSQMRAKRMSKELLKAGTMGGLCYASIHPHTVDHALSEFKGHYAIGNVLMTMNSPEYLIQTQENAISCVEKLSKKYKDSYAMTPRFAPTTHPNVMEKGALLAKNSGSFIQTHLSETESEIDYVLGLYRDIAGYENIKSYCEIYKKAGMLGPKSFFGHGIHLTKKEWEMLHQTKSVVVHCPTSNAPAREKGLGSGLFDFKKADRLKVQWCLGSDIGGGPYLSMLDVIRSFVSQNEKEGREGATFIKGLYRSTLKSAELMNLNHSCGSIENKKEMNVVLFPKVRKINEPAAEEILRILITRVPRKSLETYSSASFFKGVKCLF